MFYFDSSVVACQWFYWILLNDGILAVLFHRVLDSIPSPSGTLHILLMGLSKSIEGQETSKEHEHYGGKKKKSVELH